MQPPERFETSRLILRPPGQDDARAIYRGYGRDPEVLRYLTWPEHRDLSDTRAFLDACERDWQRGSGFTWAITERGDDRCIGMFGVALQDFMCNLGYVLKRDRWGRGYMVEAGTPVFAWLKEQPELYRVWAVCDVDNRASSRVLEKLGMDFEGIQRRAVRHNLDSEPRDQRCYAWARPAAEGTQGGTAATGA